MSDFRRAQRLMVYDRTCLGRPFLPGLTHSWIAGAWIYRGLGRLDASIGVDSWHQALQWLANRDQPIAEIQFWGHGKWGQLFVDQGCLSAEDLEPGSPHHDALAAIRERLVGPQALWWFRSCETFGAQAGHRFARAWTDFFGCRAAGHTYIIGPWQSGLHSLAPGDEIHWSASEGLKEGDPEDPQRAQWSRFSAPNTIHFLQGHVPAGF